VNGGVARCERPRASSPNAPAPNEREALNCSEQAEFDNLLATRRGAVALTSTPVVQCPLDAYNAHDLPALLAMCGETN
jgi:hypothetical protein